MQNTNPIQLYIEEIAHQPDHNQDLSDSIKVDVSGKAPKRQNATYWSTTSLRSLKIKYLIMTSHALPTTSLQPDQY